DRDADALEGAVALHDHALALGLLGDPPPVARAGPLGEHAAGEQGLPGDRLLPAAGPALQPDGDHGSALDPPDADHGGGGRHACTLRESDSTAAIRASISSSVL